MELVPIIKQTLLIVTILFLVVLVFSYAASRWKKDKPKPIRKASPKKKIEKSIKVVKNSEKNKSIKNRKRQSPKPQIPKEEKKLSYPGSSKQPNNSSSDSEEIKKKYHSSNKPPQNIRKQKGSKPSPMIEKRVEIIKDLSSSKSKINKNDSGGIGFN